MPRRFTIPHRGADIIRTAITRGNYTPLDEFAAQALGVSGCTLRAWLRGAIAIDAYNFEQLLRMTGIPIKAVFPHRLPPALEAADALDKTVGMLRDLVPSEDLGGVCHKYRDWIHAAAGRLSFHRVPMDGRFVAVEHDRTHTHHYAHVELTAPRAVEEVTFGLSLLLFGLVRLSIGHLILTPDTLTLASAFDERRHRVRRDRWRPDTIDCALWLGAEETTFFIESQGTHPLSARVCAYLRPGEMRRRKDDMLVLWNGTYCRSSRASSAS